MITSQKVFQYAFQDFPDAATAGLLGDVPERWGRMTPLSRAVVVEAGRALQKAARLENGRRLAATGQEVGLIGATRRGSLRTDLGFAATIIGGPGLASPALFAYTLPNIPLAEAANHYGLTGPVYAVFDSGNPLARAREEAQRFLQIRPGLSFMLACEFDHLEDDNEGPQLSVTFTVVI